MADCVKEVLESVSDAEKKDVEEIVNRPQELKNSNNKDFRKLANAIVKDNRMNRLVERSQKIAQENADGVLRDYLDQESLNGEPVEAVLSVFENIRKFTITGGDNNVAAISAAIKTNATIDLSNRLEKLGVLPALRDTKSDMEKHTMINLHRLSDNAQIPAEGTSRLSFEAAKIINLTQRDMLRQLQEAGSLIRELPNFIMKQSHDGFKLHDQGFDKWFDFTMARLDQDRTFGEDVFDSKKVKSTMQRIYQDIVDGNSDRAMGVTRNNPLTPKADRANLHRKLHFKDGERFFEYNNEFGTQNLLDSVVKSINSTADNIALMTRLGPDVAAGFSAMKSHVRNKIKDNPKLLAQWEKPSSQNAIDGAFKMATWQLRAGANDITKWSQGLLAFNNWRLLGKAMPSSITDTVNSAAQMKSVTGEGYLESVFLLQKNFLSLVKDPKLKKEMATMFKIQIDSQMGDTADRFSLTSNVPGNVAKANKAFFNLNLLTPQTEMGKLANTMTMGMFFGRNAKKSFSDLNLSLQEAFRGFDIGEAEWKVLKSVDFEVNGLRVLAPEGIERVPDSVISDYKRSIKSNKSEARLRKDVLNKFAAMYQDIANRGSPTPGARERRLIAQGFFFQAVKQDSAMGMVFQNAGQFKQFPATQWHLMRKLILAADPELKAKTIREALGSTKTQKSLVQSIAGMTVMGYASLALKDIIDGNEPRDPFSSESMFQSVMASGAGGLVADIMLGEHDRVGRTFTSALLGPTAGFADNAFALYSKTKRGDASMKQYFDFGWRMVPGNNLFYTKRALDYMWLNEVRESLSPGSLRRYETNVNNNPGLFNEQRQVLVPLSR
jgi:hypothetical protein